MKAVLIVLLVAGGILAPLIYWVWWLNAGGMEGENLRALEALRGRDAVVDAREAIEDEDFQLYNFERAIEVAMPELTGQERQWYGQVLGYHAARLCKGHRLTAEQEELNRAAIEYAMVYNRIVYDYVSEHRPAWRVEAEDR